MGRSAGHHRDQAVVDPRVYPRQIEIRRSSKWCGHPHPHHMH